MISEDLDIEITSNEKATLNMCTKLICDDMAAHPSLITLGPNPSWGSIPTSLDVSETGHQLQELHISEGTAIKDYSLGTYESKAALRVVQKRTKKNKCSALLCVKGFFKTFKFYEFVVTKDHAEHTPGDMPSDICTLPLAKKYLHELAQQLEQSSKSASQIRIDMLRAINEKLYHFDKDQMTSFLIWINNKLPALNFNIFKANTSYSPDPSAFAYGFMSPVQQEKMKTATSFCLDATHAISSNMNEILYTLLVRDEDIGRGWPVAFMVTNDQGVSPIVQWLQFLKRSSLLVDPKQFTIDCCAAEVHAIQTTFPATSIQFSIFHVTQAWNQKLSDSVKILGSLLSQAQILHGFKEDFDDQESFLDYFERNWCTEAKFKIWSRAYHEQQFSHMLTNNYIES
ncbi:hypothetical protein PHYBLDRAFT_150368 [Phycomyces blakesleeanus NRRL 1555(-)]|uniref:Uncharacterized protein n=1 Tax=Phycomyces blakesleeanus (strain ATCC 8743b / DSM 1359 / FGSC 10004 / NBRC 33097 / NRRL 1555) TaxID=763407 RepID=A0A167KSH5_PHYB8|nr:hypothetical protein PHYBLDRAFT_150368 [Phycomyces blakesleeanus NRRL 1555(-)]OAD68776.1 hypothetical protein PHYBLDRAFT_150368 [Phycomyces blakesleeanus NRRL 1555(-)]|eukprot:XP_018286816.1 hypothetical protein PHYBLDRAFT_150368 [Phycomyces blakesleeanus NRRL 1555(-)]